MNVNVGKTSSYQKYKEDRNKYTEDVLKSDAPQKLIVAGPGTGKSYLFEELCRKNLACGKKNNLALSFINELVDDLSIDLHELADVKTLHSLALSNIQGNDKYYLNLENIISEDYKIIYGKEINFGEILCNLAGNEEDLKFFFERRKYYNHNSPSSSVFEVVKLFQKDKAKIPKYSQVLIDEYQDFNKLESALIDLLAEKSPILIVGDDDQSIYGWKYANPEEIRLKSKSTEYKSFELPYCSRSTRIIIDAFNCIISKAKKQGLLTNRIDKRFEYYPSKKRDLVSDKFSKISIKRKVYKDSIAFHIDTQIKKLVNPKKSDNVQILVICPFRKQVKPLEKMLRKKGYRNIRTRAGGDREPLLEGFNLLIQDNNCNLGWRIVSKAILDNGEFNKIIKNSYEATQDIVNLLSPQKRKYIRSMFSTVRKIKKEEPADKEKVKEVLGYLGYDLIETSAQKLQQDLDINITRKNTHKDITIIITTIQGSKGLDGNIVFLVNFDRRFIYKNGTDITNEVVSNFLVSLTRTRNKLFIYSSDNNFPAFVDWLEKGMYEED